MKAGLRMWLSNVTIQVWPSGGALAAMAAPIAPAAPGLLSITVCQPVLSLTLAASRRATGSVVPPGGKGTTTRIGPLGQSRLRLRDSGCGDSRRGAGEYGPGGEEPSSVPPGSVLS